MSQSRAVQRLLRDLKELEAFPLLNVAAQPLDDNLLVWHVNIRGATAPLSETVFHLIIQFSEQYPTVPPSVDLCTTLPHANVFPGKFGKTNHICLDMLEDGSFADEGSKNRPYTGWSSSYTLLSLLTQLQAFLLEENMHYGAHTTLENAISQAKKFKCQICGHTGSKPWPPFEKDGASKRKIVVRKPVVILPSILDLQRAAASGKPKAQSSAAPSSGGEQAPSASSSASASSSVQAKKESHDTPKQPQQKKSEEEEWQVVSHRKKRSPEDQIPAPSFKKIAPPKDLLQSWTAVAIPKAESSEAPSKEKKTQKQQLASKSTAAEKVKAKTFIPGDYNDTSSKFKSHRRNAARRAKRDPKQGEEGKETSSPAPKQSPAVPKEQKKEEEEEQKNSSEEATSFVTVSKSKKQKGSKQEGDEESLQPPGKARHAAPAVDPKQETLSPGRGALVVLEKEKVNRKPQIGTFGRLPYEILMEILAYLSPKDVAAVAMTCRDLHLIAEDGFLWRTLFSKYYPASSLTAENVKDWKFVFMCEVNNILADLVCFHTKKSFEEDVLGIPLEFTVNPKTEKVDYIYSSMDLLSWEAYYYDKVRKSAWKESFTHWLPLYITEDHFQRALPYLKKTLLQLSPHHVTNTFHPEMALEVLSKMMNTQCVLLMDKGIHASAKALDGYFAIHRLMLAFVTHYPELSAYVDSQIAAFIRSPSKRVKEELPALGEFLPLISVSKKYTWFHISKIFMEEVFDRNVIWACRQFAGLAGDLDRKDVDMDRLTKTFEATHVSMRLIMFHVYFLTEIARPKGGSVPPELVALDYDRFYGRPSHQLRDRFQAHVNRILSAKNWPEFFSMVRMPCPTPLELSNWLRQSVRNSKRKRYHSDNTNFSAIHRSGVSKILLKGESYTASPTLRNVKLEEVWSYATPSVIFLDASCLLFDDKHEFVREVDYCHTTYENGALTHSGDVIDHAKKEGRHTINIDLKMLPPNVTNLYMTITAYTTTLKEIKQPYIRFTDADLDQELCRYNLESVETGQKTAVIMAKLSKPSPKDPWTVSAMGTICDGRASNYAPLLATIKQQAKK